ncbi:MAG: UDP-glucose 4-epimerase GalE [Planctomycetaceae bacterium]|nr:UDP-glucose 4-epimerase GalE [Planctomycetaceae bacterium]
MNVLVTGGAGYIGSHATRQLLDAGHRVVVIDNLSLGHRPAVDPRAAFAELDLGATDAIMDLLVEHKVDVVMHFAALASVPESVADPLRYYHHNTAGTVSLLRAMERHGVKRIVFSSTCATYGEPGEMPIVETMPQDPINPYGRSKLMVERILRDRAAADSGFAFTALRYFNVAGCARDGSLGEDHTPESHLIPIVIQAALGRRDSITIFGDDCPTPDGTCVRDYIHVEDLCAAHIRAMDAMTDGTARFCNLGIGRGYSVREVIDVVQQVTGRPVNVQTGPRRPGDPPSLYATAELAEREFGWKAQITDLSEIVESAWKWFESHPDGYRSD